MDNIQNAMYVSIMNVTSSCFFKDVFFGHGDCANCMNCCVKDTMIMNGKSPKSSKIECWIKLFGVLKSTKTLTPH